MGSEPMEIYSADTEMLFPIRIIPTLADLRGQSWKNFIKHLSEEEVPEIEQFAFVLLMVRLGGCVTCNTDSFRAMRGCTICAHQTIRRYRGTDEDLIDHFCQCKKEVENFIKKHQKDESSQDIDQ